MLRLPALSARFVCVFLLAVLPVGCASGPSADYVAADRATHDAIAPPTRGLIDGAIRREDLSLTDEQKIATEILGWEFRLERAPASDYVTADRKTHAVIAPTLSGILSGTLSLADINEDERQDIRNTLDVWDLRIRGEEGTANAGGPGG